MVTLAALDALDQITKKTKKNQNSLKITLLVPLKPLFDPQTRVNVPRQSRQACSIATLATILATTAAPCILARQNGFQVDTRKRIFLFSSLPSDKRKFDPRGWGGRPPATYPFQFTNNGPLNKILQRLPMLRCHRFSPVHQGILHINSFAHIV